MVDYLVLPASQLNYESYVALQKSAFSELIKEQGSSASYMTQEYYGWKYNPPGGEAKIALVMYKDQYVASNAMFPVVVKGPGGATTAWQSCDTATAPDYRGHGYFSKCLGMLIGTLGREDIFFGFPNKNSLRGFLKHGWKSRGIVTTWANPFSFHLVKRSESFSTKTFFDKSFEPLFNGSTFDETTAVFRNCEYLNWRYADHPVHKYTIIIFQEQEAVLGYVVVRTAMAFGREIALIMDLLAQNRKVERLLLNTARRWAANQKKHLTVMLDNGLGLPCGLFSGFLPVPSPLLPKKQMLMAYFKPGTIAQELFENEWRVQLGDWDVF